MLQTMDGSDDEVVVGTDGCIIVEVVAFDTFAVLHLDRNIYLSELNSRSKHLGKSNRIGIIAKYIKVVTRLSKN